MKVKQIPFFVWFSAINIGGKKVHFGKKGTEESLTLLESVCPYWNVNDEHLNDSSLWYLVAISK